MLTLFNNADAVTTFDYTLKATDIYRHRTYGKIAVKTKSEQTAIEKKS